MPFEHQAVVTLESASGVPADDVVNTWAFKRNAAPSEADLEALAQDVGDFYLTGSNPPSVDPAEFVYRYIGAQVARTALGLTVRIYDVTPNLFGLTVAEGGVPIGSPKWIKQFDTSGNPSAGTMLPAEVACVLTLRADLTGVVEEQGITRPRSRRRGRVYIGPLNTAAVEAEANVDQRVLVAAQTTFRQAANRLADDAFTNNGWIMSVWSRKAGTFYNVIDAQTDNAVDIQRRRGRRSTLRSTTIVVP